MSYADAGGFTDFLRANDTSGGDDKPVVKKAAPKTSGVEAALVESNAARAKFKDEIGTIRQQSDALKPPPMEHLPEFKPPPQTDPVQAFGSTASWLSIFGSLLTRHPLTTALNSAAGVMDAYKKNDKEAADVAYTQWKAATDNAIKLHQFQKEAYDAALAKLNTNRELAKAELETSASAFKDETSLHSLRTGDMQAFQQLQESRQRMFGALQEQQRKAEEYKTQMDIWNDVKNSPEYQAANAQKRALMYQQTFSPSVASATLREENKATTPVSSFLKKRQAEAEAAGRPWTADEEKNAMTEWNATTKVTGATTPVSSFLKKRQSEAEAAGRPWTADEEKKAMAEWNTATKVTGATAAKAQQSQEQMDRLSTQLDSLDRLIEEHPEVVGGRGMLARVGESVSGALGPTGMETPAHQYEEMLSAIRAELGKGLLNSRYFTKESRLQMEKILAGNKLGDTADIARNSIKTVRDLLGQAATSAKKDAGETAPLDAGGDYSHLWK